LDPFVRLLDNISVGLWAVISAGKGLSAGLGIVPSIILGTITAVGGGIVRDLLMNRKPESFQAGPLYGSAALLGSAVFALMKQNHVLEQYAAITCVVVVVLVRYLSVRFGWHTTPPHDYTDAVADAVTRPVVSLAERIHLPKGKLEREKDRAEYQSLLDYWKARREKSETPEDEGPR
ncbi:MAG: TRIC cation channel family protein, partial [Eggerthellaceae bacterium]|nr:TRIC cation channel family protein [Eggerthellaceae bacterium]